MKNLSLESDYQMEMSVIFNEIIVCKYFWKNLSCSEPSWYRVETKRTYENIVYSMNYFVESVIIIEQTFDYIILIGILAGMAVAWTLLFALLRFHKWRVSDPNVSRVIF